MTRVLDVVDLTVEYAADGYAVRPLEDFSMHADEGELVALLGPSGSGKTTLLSIVSGMIPATSGSVTVDGASVLDLTGASLERYRREDIGIVFQGFNLMPSLTAAENVAAPLLVAGVKRSIAIERAETLLFEVGMGDRLHHRPAKLSGGQQQRVAVARGLIGNPKLLLADEPTANLDLISAEQVVALFRRLRSDGRAIVISTHDTRLLPACDRTIEMVVADDVSVDTAGVRYLGAGELVFRQGEPSKFIYVVESGEVEIYRELIGGTEEPLGVIGAGGYFGELGPLLGFPRAATVRAKSDVVVMSYSIHDFGRQGLAN